MVSWVVVTVGGPSDTPVGKGEDAPVKKIIEV